MNKPIMYERFVAESGQTEVNLTQRYLPNTQSIQVFVNGLFIDPNDYEEASDKKIIFKQELVEGCVVVVDHVKKLTPGIRLGTGDIVGSKTTSMFKRYDGELHLQSNMKYTISLNILGRNSEYTFTSAYSPFYTTLKMIKVDLARALDGVDEDTINHTIWQNSIAVEELVEDKGAIDLKDKTGKPVRAVTEWVRYKTDLDLLNTIYLSIATNAGSVDKTLGEMRITKSVKIPYLDDLLDYYQKKLDDVEDKIAGIGVRGLAMVKAGNTSYPITARRSF